MTLGSTSTLNFTPTDDATIDASNPNTNLGTNAALTVDGSPVNDFLMRYAVSGTAGCIITKATLLLTVRTNSTAASPHAVSDDGSAGGCVRSRCGSDCNRGVVRAASAACRAADAR